MMAAQNIPFADAAQEWDLETLYEDLASAKGKHLTPVEKIHLRGLLCGHSPAEIAEKLSKQANGVETDLSATIYRYVKELTGTGDDKLESWRRVAELLENSGYKVSSIAQLRDIVPEGSVVNITNINIEKNTLVFMIRLEVPTKPTDTSDNTES